MGVETESKASFVPSHQPGGERVDGSCSGMSGLVREADILQVSPGCLTSHLCPFSFNSENFILHGPDFPKELSIKYLVNSFEGTWPLSPRMRRGSGLPSPLPTSFLLSPKPRGLSFPPLHQGKRAQEGTFSGTLGNGRAAEAPFIAENPRTQKGCVFSKVTQQGKGPVLRVMRGCPEGAPLSFRHAAQHT